MDGESEVINSEPPDAPDINRCLNHLERYIDTVDWGESTDPGFAKSAMFEATLYFLSSPFAHEHMKLARRRHGGLVRRGPRLLYLVGHSSNGKTTFLHFGMSLLTGRSTLPLAAEHFTKTKVQNAIAVGSCFPLVFDDLNPAQKSSFQDIIKSHWEVWWRPDHPSPQLIFSTNAHSLHEWAKSRVKRINFDVQFAENSHNTTRLAQILEEPNPLFRWFSALYIKELQRLDEPPDDELHLARVVVRDLYDRANRSLPSYFTQSPLEDLYNPDRLVWQELIRGSKLATLRHNRKRIIVEFSRDLQHYEVKQYEGALPQTIKYKARAKTVTIENPSTFMAWLDGKENNNRNWLDKIFRR